MTEDTPFLSDEERALLQATDAAPPPGFTDRVLAARQGTAPADAKPAPSRRPRPAVALAVGLATLAALVLAAVLPRLHKPSVTSGIVTAGERTTFAIAGRAVAVAEVGSEVSWTSVSGPTRVRQPRGNVFYRVGPGASFVVLTPAGEVSVKGTCFRVEVSDMKPSPQSLAGAAVGAGLAAAVLVTVYEGRVLLANPRGETAVAAGQRSLARAGSAPGAAVEALAASAPDLSAPPATLTREGLLVRATAQAQQIARLEAQVKKLEAGGGAPRGKPAVPGDDSFLDSTPEQLARLAADCRLRWDMPDLSVEGDHLDRDKAAQAGFAEADRVKLNQVLHDLQARVTDQVRQLYIEVTGDVDNADELSWQALLGEIENESRRRDIQEAFRRISAERAGLAAPPPDLSRTPPVERMYRILTSVGDETEREIGKVVGPERAAELRRMEGGWGSRHDWSNGCPDGK